MASADKDDMEENRIDKENYPEFPGLPEPEVVLDLSGRKLKKLERAPINQTFATALVLDNNLLQNLVNLDSYGELLRLSAANNQIVRMYWFARMYSLRILNLPNNSIVHLEGLRELHHLIHLNVSGNSIKNMDGLIHSQKLEHLNLSGNAITLINDISTLKNLKELFLHRNRISSLHRCNKYLPIKLYILTLSDNCISDLNDLCNLSHLTSLEQFTILNNPCLDPVEQTDACGVQIGPPLDFDNRPYVINWCLNLKVLDGYKVTPKESLKAEWLYSQGKGRHFQVGEHPALVQYLSGVCLAGGGWGGADLPDDDAKLGKILQLAKHHQQQLRHSISVDEQSSDYASPVQAGKAGSIPSSPGTARRSAERLNANKRSAVSSRPSKASNEDPRKAGSHASTSSVRQIQQDSTLNSYHVELSSTLYGGDLKTPDTPGLMTRSMDPMLLAQLSTPETLPVHQKLPIHPMSQSLGPQQMARTLESDYMASLHEYRKPRQQDLMTQSLGPDQLRMNLSSDSYDGRMIRSNSEYPSSLYESEEMKGYYESVNHLEGSSQFVPAPDSMMSPEFQSALSQTDHLSSSTHAKSINKSLKSGRSAMRPTSSHAPSKTAPQTSSSQRPKTAPTKSAPPDSSKGSPRSRQRTQAQSRQTQSNTSPKTTRQSPKPTQRSTSSNVGSSSIRQSNSTSSVGGIISPVTPKGASEGESDNTDSEISVSKLKTIKSIAAERKNEERSGRSTGDPSFARGRAAAARTSNRVYDPDKYKAGTRLQNQEKGSKSSVKEGATKLGKRSDSTIESRAAVTLQKHWRGYRARHHDLEAARVREEIKHSRAEKHIRYLTEKLKAAESALEKERKLRHLQLEAIRSLWREIQKLQAGRFKDGVQTPSTPMTPLTPVTPIDSGKKGMVGVGVGGSRSKVYSEESVKELTQFCDSLQTQVSDLHKSLAMVTQVMNAFCHLPGSQALLTRAQCCESSGNDGLLDPEGGTAHFNESIATFTHSISALTSSIQNDSAVKKQQQIDNRDCGKPSDPEGAASTVSSSDRNSTGLDVSTLSNDSTEEAETACHQEATSYPVTEGPHKPGDGKGHPATGPQRPSSLPVARSNAPRGTS